MEAWCDEQAELKRKHEWRLFWIKVRYWFLIFCVAGAIVLPILLMYLLTRR